MAKAKNQRGRLFTRGKNKYYYLQYYINGKQIVQRLTDEDGASITTRGIAEKAREKILAPVLAKDEVLRRRLVYNAMRDAEEAAKEAEENAKDKLTLANAWQAYLSSPKRRDSSEATLAQYSFQWDRFAKWAEKMGLKTVAEVKPENGSDYAVNLNVSGLSNNTFNKHIRLLKMVFRVLAETPVNPFAGIQSKIEEQNSREEMPWDKLCEVCDKTEGEMKTLFFLGIYTGQRLKDCVLLTWDKVDLMRGWILMQPAKTKRRSKGKTLHIPILPDLQNMLETTPAPQRTGYVLPELAEHYNTNRDRITDRIQTILLNCGIQIHRPGTGIYKDKDGNKIHTGKRAVLQYGFHSLRHTTVTLLQEAGVAQSVTQAVVGQRTVAMTQRYTHVGRDAIQAAMKTLPSIIKADNQEQGVERTEQQKRNRLARLAVELPLEKIDALLAYAEQLASGALCLASQ